MPSLKRDSKGWKMQAKNKTRLEELERRNGKDGGKVLAIEWIRDGESSIEYDGKRYSGEEFRKLYPKVKILTVEVVR